MLNSQDVDRLNSLCAELVQLEKNFTPSKYNAPINRSEEWERFKTAYGSGKIYNPQFRYNETPTELERPFVEFLRFLQPDRTYWDQLLFQHVVNTLVQLRSLASHDPAHITAESIGTHGMVSQDLLAYAQEILANTLTHIPLEKDISDKEASITFQSALETAGLHDWQVIINPTMNARIMVQSSRQEIHIQQDSLFAKAELNRFLVHEIGTHVFRYTNGTLQRLELLKMGLSGYLLTEEGMAAYNEKRFLLSDSESMRRYALRVVAAHMSLTQSFNDVFVSIAKFTSQEEAFAIVSRAKRGFTDTSQLGAHVKDKVYLEGFFTISQHLGENPLDYVTLMAGKISLESLVQIDELRSLDILVAPKYLPEQLITLGYN